MLQKKQGNRFTKPPDSDVHIINQFLFIQVSFTLANKVVNTSRTTRDTRSGHNLTFLPEVARLETGHSEYTYVLSANEVSYEEDLDECRYRASPFA
ncbi:MAG: hypothetical protein M5U34_09250 [Chloroflexi bacterium]|nr:hypothetical protein [Chloroflexota bacterium]